MLESASPSSPWVARFAPLIPEGGEVLDLACGSGRHACLLAGMGYKVEAVDRDAVALEAMAGIDGITTRCADLESGPWPYYARTFDGIIVSRYLFRPLFPAIFNCLEIGGILIYETFMEGQQLLGKPSNPAFLLRSGELLDVIGKRFTVIAFEQGEVAGEKDNPPQVIQRICVSRSRNARLLR